MSATTAVEIKNKNSIMAVAKAVILAIIISLIAIIVQALCLKFLDMNENLIPLVNQIIKGFSIFIACIFSIRGMQNGWLKGALIGIIYIVLAYAIFSILYQQFSPDLSLFNDIVLGAATGLFSGVISAHIAK